MENDFAIDAHLRKVKSILTEKGLYDGENLTTLSDFKKHVDPHKFTGDAGYKVYLGDAGGLNIGLIEYRPPFSTKNKTTAIELFWGSIKRLINLNDLEEITDGNIRTCQQYSISW